MDYESFKEKFMEVLKKQAACSGRRGCSFYSDCEQTE